MQYKSLTINTDGGSRGNPGPAAYGVVVKEDGEVIHMENGKLGIATNNQAEYTGVLKANEWLVKQKNEIQKVTFILDSELVVRQLSGIYKVKDSKIKEFVTEIKKHESSFLFPVSYLSVPRSQNSEADALVNNALDQ